MEMDFMGFAEMMQDWKETRRNMDIDRVLYNGPATIVFFKDGTKSVAKCGDKDEFDYEKGLAMAIVKKIYSRKQFKEILENAEEGNREREEV